MSASVPKLRIHPPQDQRREEEEELEILFHDLWYGTYVYGRRTKSKSR